MYRGGEQGMEEVRDRECRPGLERIVLKNTVHLFNRDYQLQIGKLGMIKVFNYEKGPWLVCQDRKFFLSKPMND